MNADQRRSENHTAIARRRAVRAKNFYYSFLLLDKTQRDAMCAIYAFIRHCDDLSDDLRSRESRFGKRSPTGGWNSIARCKASWRAPRLAGFRDTVQRYRFRIASFTK